MTLENAPLPKKILAVDDERHIVDIIQTNLERAGYQVVTALSGREALDIVEGEKPDLIIIDATMPYMDGFELLQTLRISKATRDLPVLMLMLTGQDAEVFRVGWQRGVDCYITKPFNPMELVSLVRH